MEFSIPEMIWQPHNYQEPMLFLFCCSPILNMWNFLLLELHILCWYSNQQKWGRINKVYPFLLGIPKEATT